jgi:L-ascorbate metabolism protein UlaG (beta-lactamase superfamily)
MSKTSSAFLVAMAAHAAFAPQGYEEDIFNAGDSTTLKITFFGHATLMITHGKTVIHVDPVEEFANYAKLPKADLVLVTHAHSDHFSPSAISAIRTAATEIVLTEACSSKIQGGTVLSNGDAKIVKGIRVEAIPAYNIVHMRSAGAPFHPRGEGNGYLLSLGKMRVYIAGDTENTPEMKAVKDIDIAFLPMNLPYTMTPEMVADAALAMRPKVLYPYHFGSTEVSRLTALLAGAKDIDVRVRKMQ